MSKKKSTDPSANPASKGSLAWPSSLPPNQYAPSLIPLYIKPILNAMFLVIKFGSSVNLPYSNAL